MKKIVLLCVLLLAGCGTVGSPGRFALIDLDGRSDTQRAADSPAEQAMWSGQSGARPPDVKDKGIWMSIVSSIGSFINFRFTLLECEWGKPGSVVPERK